MRVSGLVCTILVDLEFFMPLPVSTLADWISTSKSPVERSGDANVRVASHFQSTLYGHRSFHVELNRASTGITSKTGACARLARGNMATKKQRVVNRMESLIVVSAWRQRCSAE